jgi:predicted nuclease of predicted toxin-antitoxin system
MIFLLNMNVCRAVGLTLEDLGQQWVHARDVGLARADDRAVVDLARREGMTIITHDLDYADILALSGQAHPSVIIFRLRLSSPPVMCRRLHEAWAGMHEALGQGAIVVIEDAAVRIRSLSGEPD